MGRVSHNAIIGAPRKVVFDYINGYQNVPEYMFGITTFDPVTDQTAGLGSKFQAVMDVGVKSLKSTVETTEWVENELIHLESVDGFAANTTWRFADADGGTRLDVVFEYKLPGGLAGRALGVVLEPFIGQGIKQTEASIREHTAG